ncbi:MAG: YgjV family protein [Oscillospiraceae bacterium]|jgi:hypothetical protein|nr:YgjV family protein [Oscillospiraceae bacterium]
MLFISAQIIGVLVIIVGAIASHMKTKSALLLCMVAVNVLLIAEFSLLGAITEVAVISVALVRSVTFFLYSKFGKKAPAWLLALFIAAQITAVILTWKSWICVLMVFDALETYGQWQNNLKVTRITIIVASVPVGIYNLLVRGDTGAINSAVRAVSASIALWHNHYRKRDKAKQA